MECPRPGAQYSVMLEFPHSDNRLCLPQGLSQADLANQHFLVLICLKLTFFILSTVAS